MPGRSNADGGYVVDDMVFGAVNTATLPTVTLRGRQVNNYFPLPTRDFANECSDANAPRFLRNVNPGRDAQCFTVVTAADLGAKCTTELDGQRFASGLYAARTCSPSLQDASTYVAVRVGTVSRRMAYGDIVTGLSAVPAAAFSGGVCQDAALEVRSAVFGGRRATEHPASCVMQVQYVFDYTDTGRVTAVTANVVLGDVTVGSAAFVSVRRQFTVQWNTTGAILNSGYPGYLPGAPVLAGTVATQVVLPPPSSPRPPLLIVLCALCVNAGFAERREPLCGRLPGAGTHAVGRVQRVGHTAHGALPPRRDVRLRAAVEPGRARGVLLGVWRAAGSRTVQGSRADFAASPARARRRAPAVRGHSAGPVWQRRPQRRLAVGDHQQRGYVNVRHTVRAQCGATRTCLRRPNDWSPEQRKCSTVNALNVLRTCVFVPFPVSFSLSPPALTIDAAQIQLLVVDLGNTQSPQVPHALNNYSRATRSHSRDVTAQDPGRQEHSCRRGVVCARASASLRAVASHPRSASQTQEVHEYRHERAAKLPCDRDRDFRPVRRVRSLVRSACVRACVIAMAQVVDGAAAVRTASAAQATARRAVPAVHRQLSGPAQRCLTRSAAASAAARGASCMRAEARAVALPSPPPPRIRLPCAGASSRHHALPRTAQSRAAAWLRRVRPPFRGPTLAAL
jgi:hypothetical protein